MEESKYLYEIAQKAKEMSYSPYSNFRVGAAVLTKDGTVYFGCNIENSSYSGTICAERVAISKAVSEGKRDIVKIAIASDNNSYVYPCGICKQFMSEFMKDSIIVIGNDKGIKEIPFKELEPYMFTSEDLNR